MREGGRQRGGMNLKKLYTQSSSAGDGGGNSKSAELAAAATVAMDMVEEFVGSLNHRRLYREATLALRAGLRDARAEFSFLRVRGLRCILNFLHSVADSDKMIQLFCLTQSLADLQGIESLISLVHEFDCEIVAITLKSIGECSHFRNANEILVVVC